MSSIPILVFVCGFYFCGSKSVCEISKNHENLHLVKIFLLYGNLPNLTLPEEADLDCDGRLHIDIDIPACLLLARVPFGCIEWCLFLERSLPLRVMEALGPWVVRGEIVSEDSSKFPEDTPSRESSFDWTWCVTDDEFMFGVSTECLRVCFFTFFSTDLFSVVSLPGTSSSLVSTQSLGSLLTFSVASPSSCLGEGISGGTGFSSGFTWVLVLSWRVLCGLIAGLGTETVSPVQHRQSHRQAK